MSDLAAIAASALPAAVEAGETELARGLAGLLGQVYGDTVSPGAKQIGAMIEDIVKTVRLLAWPMQMGAVLQDRFRRDLTTAIEIVPEKDRQVPALKLFADCCEGSKFEDDPTLREMWLQLLSRGCDKKRVGEAHPAFPGIIRQISAQEAILLSLIENSTVDNRLTYAARSWVDHGKEKIEFQASSEWKKRLAFFPNFHFGVSHLRQLDLIQVKSHGGTWSPGIGGDPDLSRENLTCVLSWWGIEFMKAVSTTTSKKS